METMKEIGMEKITAGHVLELAASSAVDSALVRYDDGRLEVRSLITRGSDDPEDSFDEITTRDGLHDLTDEWDGGREMDEGVAAEIAESLNWN